MAKKKRRKLNFARLALAILILVIMAAGGAVLALVYSSVASMPAFNPNEIAFAASTEIYDENNQLVTRIGPEKRIPVKLEQVPEMVQNAFIAIEDNRFRNHKGVDIYRIFGAAIADIKSGSLKEGASTITQQVVRQATDIGTEKTFQRKIQEAILAIQMERHFTKDEILEFYLNGIYLGEGAYGVEAASQTYFNKSINELELEEAALLAGLPQAPSAYNPYVNKEAAQKRRNIVLDQMAKYGYITESEAAAAKAKDIVLEPGEIRANEYPYPFFVDYVIQTLTLENDKYNLDESEIYRGGLKIYTTLNPKMQTAAEEAVANLKLPGETKDENGYLQPNAAAVILDPYTGQVKALVGGRKHIGMGLNRATYRPGDPGRPPGSTFKPIAAYGPAIEYLNKGPASIIDDAPREGGWPANYGAYYGLVTMRFALQNSLNVVAVKLMEEVGPDKAVAFTKKLGFERIDPYLSTALGALKYGVTPLQLAAAYGAFANKGIYIEPSVIKRIERLDGTVVYEHEPKQHRAMKETTAFLLTDMLQTVVSRGTGTAAQLPNRPVAGKTGTADNENGRTSDIWFAGYTPNLVGVTWIGNDQDGTPLPTSSYFGGVYTAQLWREMMLKAHDGLPSKKFPGPPSGLVRATVDSKSGLLPGPLTPDDQKVTDWFIKGTVPTKEDDMRVVMDVCAETGLLPSEYCPERIQKVVLKVPYSVSPNVQDYGLRAPTEVCNVHSEETLSDWLPDNGEQNGPWFPEPNDGEQEHQHNGNDNYTDSRQNNSLSWKKWLPTNN